MKGDAETTPSMRLYALHDLCRGSLSPLESGIRIWGLMPRRRSLISSWAPVITAMTRMMAITPMAMPTMEIHVVKEMNLSFLFDLQVTQGDGRLVVHCVHLRLHLRPQEREEDDLPDRLAVGEQHGEAVDPDALARRRRQPVFEGHDIILIHCRAFFFLPYLIDEPRLLVFRVVQLVKPVGNLHAAHVKLEPLGHLRSFL